MPDLTHLQIIFMGVISTEIMLFFVMNGSDFGAGMATLFVGRDTESRNQIVDVSGPVWGSNEAWAVTAFAMMFAAFPGWYAALASGYYLGIFALLFFLIFRGVAFDYRNQWHIKNYNRFWDWALFFGSLLPPFLLGVVFSSTVSGVPIRNGFVYAGLGDVLTPFTIIGGLLAVLLSLNIGLTRVIKKVSDELATQLIPSLKWTTYLIYLFAAIFVIMLPFNTKFFSHRPGIVTTLLIVLALAMIVENWAIQKNHRHTAYWLSAVAMGSFIYTIFLGVFPTLIVGKTIGTNITAVSAASGRESLLWTAWLFGFGIPIMIIVQAMAYHMINKYFNDKPSQMLKN